MKKCSLFTTLLLTQFSTNKARKAKRVASETLVQCLLELRGAGDEVPALEAELNRRVYGLFGLSEEEVRIVEEEKG